MRRTRLAFAIAASASLLAAPRLADACGGVFSSDLPGQSEVVTVTSQRIALSISSEQTVLWSQIAYEGDPSDFAWVLPVGQGAVLEASNDAWFEALEAFTATRVSSPSITCYDGSGSGSGSSSGGCCGSSLGDGLAGSAPDRGNFGQGGEVTVVHEGSVGEYQTVTLSSSSGEAVQQWLVDNGYAVPDTVVPALEAYAAQGLDFIAMRLRPDASIKQMTPVRVRAPGGSTIVPMRMMAAGAGASVPLTLYVLGEGRYAPSNFPNVEVDTSDLTWDFDTESSDYEARRTEALSAEGGRGFLTSHASRQALHGRSEQRALTPEGLSPTPENTAYTIADLYALQGTTTATGEGSSCDLSAMLESYRALPAVARIVQDLLHAALRVAQDDRGAPAAVQVDGRLAAEVEHHLGQLLQAHADGLCAYCGRPSSSFSQGAFSAMKMWAVGANAIMSSKAAKGRP